MKSALQNAAKNFLLLLGAIVFSLFLLEGAFRIWTGVPVFSPTNFRTDNTMGSLMGTVMYDRELGWAHIPNSSFEQVIPNSSRRYLLKSMAYGIRQNGANDNVLRTGGVLAVGDSFTAGSEVMNEDSWPAQLEKILQRPVLNAGVGAYGSDQIIMRAEKLLPIALPKILIVGMLDQDILRTGYSSFGAPKPYYTVEDGKLVLHNSPVPTLETLDRTTGLLKNLAGHSLVVDRIMKSYFPVGWGGTGNQVFTQTGIDEVEVTCLLLKRLKQKADALNVRALLLMQYGGGFIAVSDQRRDFAVQVEQCAETMGYQVVDEFESLKAIFTASTVEFQKYYRMVGNAYGHMSEAGNQHIAQLLAASLRAPSPAGRAEDYVIPFSPGEGRNLLPNSEALDKVVAKSRIASLQTLTKAADTHQIYRVAATGCRRGEHYVQLNVAGLPSGPYMLSLEVKDDGTSHIRVQIIDSKSNGAIGDFNLTQKSVGTSRAGAAGNLRAGVKEAEDGWYRVWLGATLPVGGNTSILLGVNDSTGKTRFWPLGEAYRLRALQLERGQSPSPYRPSEP